MLVRFTLAYDGGRLPRLGAAARRAHGRGCARRRPRRALPLGRTARGRGADRRRRPRARERRLGRGERRAAARARGARAQRAPSRRPRGRAAERAPAGFHARFSARRARIATASGARATRSPFELGRSLWQPRPLDLERLARLRALLLGEHDFRAFTPTDTQHQVFVRDGPRRALARARRAALEFEITADSFLRHMVRTLVGTMLERGPSELAALLAGRRASAAGSTAPACGLYLVAVGYAGRAAAGDAPRAGASRLAVVGACASGWCCSISTAPSSIRPGSSSPRCATRRGRCSDVTIPDAELMAAVGGPGLEAQMRDFGGDEHVDELIRVYRAHNEPLHAGIELFPGWRRCSRGCGRRGESSVSSRRSVV